MLKDFGPTLSAAVLFAFHVVVAGILFGLIVVVASALYVLAHFLSAHGWVPPWVATGIGGIENLTFILDAICYVWFIFFEAFKFCKLVWLARKGH